MYISTHPLERRIGYVHDIKDINNIELKDKNRLQKWFKKHPCLIFTGINDVSPKDFLNFVKEFDEDRDEDALFNPEHFQHQILQPLDQFTECKYVAPRGNIELSNFYNISNVSVYPAEPFLNNYMWNIDILGHEYKLPNVITGFYVVEQPLIGGDTDFISGETIYENLTEEEQKAAQNLLVEINRRKFVTNSIKMDYSGTSRLEEFVRWQDGTQQIPIVYGPESEEESPRILLMPTFFEKVVGWSIKDSREWIKQFVTKKIMPHRVSIQWRKGDLAVFNNRRFIHSNTPARNYMSNQNSKNQLILQTLIPTKKSLIGICPNEKDDCATYNVGWNTDKVVAINSVYTHIKYARIKMEENKSPMCQDGMYILHKKPKGLPEQIL